MAINRDKPDNWKSDIVKSVDFYNNWFMEFAPKAFRETRIVTSNKVAEALKITDNLKNISLDILKQYPEILPILRMSTCPPIARDRLIGLSGVSKNLVFKMEDLSKPCIPPRMNVVELDNQLLKIVNTITKMIDVDIFPWITNNLDITEIDINRASTIIADRLCGSISDPIIRNAQEKRQLESIKNFLEDIGYVLKNDKITNKFDQLNPGEFSFRTNVPANLGGDGKLVNIPIDVIIKPKKSSVNDFPILLEAKSAGDFANVNKRRKEEAHKMQQLKATYGQNINFGLFLCGYFDSGYLGYEAAEGIDWIWEHRISDLIHFGL